MVPIQTSAVLWYCKNDDEKQHVVVLALEGVDRMCGEAGAILVFRRSRMTEADEIVMVKRGSVNLTEPFRFDSSRPKRGTSPVWLPPNYGANAPQGQAELLTGFRLLCYSNSTVTFETPFMLNAHRRQDQLDIASGWRTPEQVEKDNDLLGGDPRKFVPRNMREACERL
jgi:hypothetical protein